MKINNEVKIVIFDVQIVFGDLLHKFVLQHTVINGKPVNVL